MRNALRRLGQMMSKALAWCLAAVAFGGNAASGGEGNLKARFDELGLAGIVHNGRELIDTEDPRFMLQMVRFADDKAKEGFRQIWEPKPTEIAFDVEKKTLALAYEWGRIECAFAVGKDRLDLRIDLANTSPDPIRECAFFPFFLALPNDPRNAGEWHHPGDVAGHLYVHEQGTIAVLGQGAYFYLKTGKRGSRPLYVPGPRPANQPYHPIVDSSYWHDPGALVLPGKSAAYRVSLVFGPPNASLFDLAADAYAAYAKARPMVLKWPDRRPIATIFLCNPATGSKTNPRGWFQGEARIDVTTEEGMQAFGERLRQYADGCLERMKAMDAQGVIVWDIEGQEMPHMISYIGDPRPLAKLAPEMDRFADAFMKKFRDAGFRTGITIRPTEIYQPGEAGKPLWQQREVKDPVATMSAKIKYAQKRWGCTIFYLDSSVFGDDLLTDEQKKMKRGIPWVMPASMIEKLARLHPDCLIAPEFAQFEHYRFSAPYSSPNLGDGGTSPTVRQVWQEAFRLVGVRQDLLEKRWEHFAESVENGDILLFHPWWDAPENTFVKLLYREAEMRRQGALALLSHADLPTLQAKVKDNDEKMRYAAATSLGKFGNAEAIAALAALLQDESPLVQKQALVSLAQAPQISDQECIGLLLTWIRGSQDHVRNTLRVFAADALARAGDAAVPQILALLADPQAAAAWPYAMRALARSGTADAKAVAALLAFVQEALPPKAALRNDAIEALGLLKAKEAVPALLAILEKRDRDSEAERGAAVVALGHIGDARAIEALVKHFDVPYSTVVVYWIQEAIDDALRAITGEKNIVGGQEWKAWWQKKQEAERR